MGMSVSESEYAKDSLRSMSRRWASSRIAIALFSPWAKNSISPVNLPCSSILARDEIDPVMPSSSAKGSTISAGDMLTSQTSSPWARW